MGRFPREEPVIYGGVLVEDLPLKETQQDEVSMDSQDLPPPWRTSGIRCKPPLAHLNTYTK